METVVAGLVAPRALASTPAQRDALGRFGASLFGTVSLLGLDGNHGETSLRTALDWPCS